jgi:hypothetical protein
MEKLWKSIPRKFLLTSELSLGLGTRNLIFTESENFKSKVKMNLILCQSASQEHEGNTQMVSGGI